MLRITETDKWKDRWFRDLEPPEKLVFIYLYENCDDAGFIDIDFTNWGRDLKMTNDKIKECIINLQKCYIINRKECKPRKIWIKKFLLYQDKLPLNEQVIEHRVILGKIRLNMEDFGESPELVKILGMVINKRQKQKNSNTANRPKMPIPSLEEFSKYFKEKFPAVDDNEITSMYSHYNSVGWVIGKSRKPMVSWQDAITKNMANKELKQSKPSKVETAFEVKNALNRMHNR